MNKVRDALIGLAVGDAIGVPVEFQSREELDKNPVIDMREYGTYNQPKGTWSDDSSLTFCLADSLISGYNLKDIANKFIAWRDNNEWTPHGTVFDIGITTTKSISKLKKHIYDNNEESIKSINSDADEFSNGNGSLMRILPIYFYIKDFQIKKQFEIIWEVSALTHGHIRSAISCLIYLVLIDEILKEKTKFEAYKETQQKIKTFFQLQQISEFEQKHFRRLIDKDISKVDRKEIQSSGYVIHSLEASFWCFLNSKTYKDTILNAVNLGHDTDTTAAIVGGITGIYYGEQAIPESWRNNLVKKEEIENLCDKLNRKYKS